MSIIRKIRHEGQVDSNNSTSTPLGGGAAFTGTATDILDYGIVFVSVYSNVASATDGLSIQQSIDGTNWDHSDVYTVPAGVGKNYSINPHARYVRVVYTNGAGAQGSFRLQTVLKGNSKPSSHRIQSAISDDDDAELVKSVLTGKDPTGDFVNVGTTVDGFLAISDNSDGLAIAKGDVTGHSFIHKFGVAVDFDTGDGAVTIWDGADDANIDQMVYQYSTSADIDSISSSQAADTQNIKIFGLDGSGNLVEQTATLSGQTRVALGTSLKRVHRMVNVSSTDLTGYVYCYVNTTLSSGVPVDSTKVRAIIQVNPYIPVNQTLMAVYTIPTGYTGYLREWYASLGGGSRTSNYIVYLLARPSGQVFQVKHVSAIAEDGSSSIQHKYVEPEVFEAGTDIELRVRAESASITAAKIGGGFDIVLVAD
jgi:hypothetical protein